MGRFQVQDSRCEGLRGRKWSGKCLPSSRQVQRRRRGHLRSEGQLPASGAVGEGAAAHSYSLEGTGAEEVCGDMVIDVGGEQAS